MTAQQRRARGSELSRTGRRHLAIIVLLLGSAFFVLHEGTMYCTQSDLSGYMNEARLLARGDLSEDLRVPAGSSAREFRPRLFVPIQYERDDDAAHARIIPNRFIGWPLQLAVAWRLFGVVRGGLLAVALLFAGHNLLLYLIGLELGLARIWAFAVALAMALYPTALSSFPVAMSDGAAATWCVAVLYFALLSRRRPGAALAAGLCLGVAVLVRPPNVLVLPASLVAMWTDLPPLPSSLAARRRLESLRALLLGGLGPALVFAARLHQLHGHAAGQGAWDSSFGWVYVVPRLKLFAALAAHDVGTLPVVLWLLGLLYVPFHARIRLLTIWTVPVLLFYAAYRHTESGGEARYLLPVDGAMLLVIAMVIRSFEQVAHERIGSLALRRAVELGALAVFATVLVEWRHFQVSRPNVAVPRVDLGTWLRGRVPEGSPVLAEAQAGEIYFYTRLPTVNWNGLSEPELAAVRTNAAKAGRSTYAIINHLEAAPFRSKFGSAFVLHDTGDTVSLWIAK